MAARRIALLGAQGTGKTTLAGALADHLRRRGLRAEAVAGVPREDGRPPPEKQLATAREQERRVDAAAPGCDVVIADTTALMVAARAGTLPEEGALLRFALERQQGYDATLLMGLDIAAAPGGPQGAGAPAREGIDALLRTLLQRAGVPFQVVYGQGPQRLQSALRSLEGAGVLPPLTGERRDEGDGRPWTWVCDKCSDPACEHRLFTRLRSS